MANEVQTQTGRCATHGTVQASREIPRITFPFVVFAVMRAMAMWRRPYTCPECGAAVTTD
jgi:hypothetical protein